MSIHCAASAGISGRKCVGFDQSRDRSRCAHSRVSYDGDIVVAYDMQTEMPMTASSTPLGNARYRDMAVLPALARLIDSAPTSHGDAVEQCGTDNRQRNKPASRERAEGDVIFGRQAEIAGRDDALARRRERHDMAISGGVVNATALGAAVLDHREQYGRIYAFPTLRPITSLYHAALPALHRRYRRGVDEAKSAHSGSRRQSSRPNG